METETGKSFVEQLAARVGAQAGAATVFGEPVERDEITVIPVARAGWGFGGGSGTAPGGESGGEGGGGGAVAWPVGYIEIRGQETRFRPIVDLRPFVVIGALGLAAGIVAAARR
jgi:uncharacterized spore protein YtfJ